MLFPAGRRRKRGGRGNKAATFCQWTIERTFGIISTWASGCTVGIQYKHIKAIKRGQLCAVPTLFRERRRRYDWSAVQAYYENGHTYRQCREKFGFCAEAWTKAVDRGELKARARRLPLEDLVGHEQLAQGGKNPPAGGGTTPE
jgi:hypothetical protein